MKELYYTPTIEELHPGFEYEVKRGFLDGTVKTQEDYDRSEWLKTTCDSAIMYIERALNGRNSERGICGVRVKYLDKEDIESLGLTKNPKGYENGLLSLSELGKVKNGVLIKIRYHWDWNKSEPERENLIRIFTGRIYEYPYKEIFRGNIKNKSEFKRILTQLDII